MEEGVEYLLAEGVVDGVAVDRGEEEASRRIDDVGVIGGHGW